MRAFVISDMSHTKPEPRLSPPIVVTIAINTMSTVKIMLKMNLLVADLKRYWHALLPYTAHASIVEKAKSGSIVLYTIVPKYPNTLLNAVMGTVELTMSGDVVFCPEVRTRRAVRVHMTNVSRNTSNIPHIPCFTGSFCVAVE